MLNKARGSPKLVIITAEGTNSLIAVLEDQVPQLDLSRREGKTGQRHVNHIGRSPSQMPLSDPQGVKERGTSMPCLCKGNREILSSSLVWLKTEVERNWNRFLIFVWFGRTLSHSKSKWTVQKTAFFQMTSKKPLPKSKLIQKLKKITVNKLR